MSNLSQFSNTPAVGEYALFNAPSVGINPTVNGKEYLAPGYSKTYSATYANLMAASSKAYGYFALTAPNSTWAQSGGTRLTCTTDGNFNLWTSAATGKVYSGTSLTSSRTGGGGSLGSTTVTSDGVTFNNILLNCAYETTAWGAYVYYSSNYGSTWLTGATNVYGADGAYPLIATNGSTTAAFCNSISGTAAGGVLTTTNGTTWTSRTFSADMTVGSTVQISRMVYSTVLSAYVYVNSVGSIWTATDGYTLTSRTAPSGMPTTITPNTRFLSNYSASSASTTLIMLNTTQALKITSGPTFSIINLPSTIAGWPTASDQSSVSPYITYDGTRFIIAVYPNFIFTSSDEGVTWTTQYKIYGTATNYAGVSWISAINYVNSQLVIFGGAITGPGIITGLTSASTPNYVGSYSYNVSNQFLRIA